jgi:GTP-binding protein
VLLLDIRHGPTELDRQMITWLMASGKLALFLLTKSDKLPRGKALERTREIAHELSAPEGGNVIVFSAKTGAGKSETWGAIDGLISLRKSSAFH